MASLTNDFKGVLLIKRNKIKDSFNQNNGLSNDELFAQSLSITQEEADIDLLKANKGSNQFRKQERQIDSILPQCKLWIKIE